MYGCALIWNFSSNDALDSSRVSAANKCDVEFNSRGEFHIYS